MSKIEASDIRVQDLDHCGLIAGICDSMGLVEQLDRLLGTHPQEIVTPGQAVKAILKQFMVDLMCSGDGDVPLYLRVGSGNETDSGVFARLILEFKQQWDVDALFVADAALYTAPNLQQMAQLRWVSRVPATLTSAKDLLQQIHPDAFVPSSLAGYQIAACCNCYASIPQRWLVVKSQARLESDLKQLEKRLAKHEAKARAALKQLQSQKFACQPDALTAAALFSQQLPYHQLQDLQAIEIVEHKKRGRPSKNAVGEKYYQIRAVLAPKDSVIDAERQRAGLFLLATNVLDSQVLSNDQILQEYKAQQSTERGLMIRAHREGKLNKQRYFASRFTWEIAEEGVAHEVRYLNLYLIRSLRIPSRVQVLNQSEFSTIFLDFNRTLEMLDIALPILARSVAQSLKNTRFCDRTCGMWDHW